eukprot:TRINITY_DN7094_c0_g1_i1.p1 TRINITY_DN7094_c0_g1~~TRINITY_DN7094_c0_g1_i1.p1  ORF type:complete len:204 (+),score=31.46 TRINITY_DN7094_c0_g1_i1:107-718(+)
MFGTKNTSAPSTDPSGRKYKPYRNRPSKRQTLLEIFSFCLLIVSAPAWLGGVISIFVCYFGVALGLIGLFAWTRRHAFLFSLLAVCLIALCIVNIILRAVFVGQCLPFFNYNNGFGNSNTGNGDRTTPITSNHQNNHYDNSIWCGNNYIVYITHGLIILFALLGLIMALSLLFRRKINNGALPVAQQQTTTTRTVESKTFATA